MVNKHLMRPYTLEEGDKRDAEIAELKAENLKLKAIAIVADELLRDLKIAWGNHAEAAMTGNKYEHLENLLNVWKAGSE